MPWTTLALTAALMFGAALAVAALKGTGCLPSLGRIIALIVGSVLPLLVVWWRHPAPEGGALVPLLVSLGAFILNEAGLILAASGLQILFYGDLRDDALDGAGSLFDTNLYTPISGNSADIDDLFGLLLMLVVGVLVLVGVVLAAYIDGLLVPKKTGSTVNRLLRAVISLVLAGALHVGAVALALWALGALQAARSVELPPGPT